MPTEIVGSYALYEEGRHTITSDEASANTVSIPTRFNRVTNALVQIVDSGNNDVTADADITWSGSTLIVADGSTYNTTAGYVIRYLVFGVGGL